MRCGAIPKKLWTTTISSNAFCEIGDKNKEEFPVGISVLVIV